MALLLLSTTEIVSLRAPMCKICKSCKAGLEYRADDIGHCSSNKIVLSENETGRIKYQYKDCLCAECLKEITIISFYVSEKYL